MTFFTDAIAEFGAQLAALGFEPRGDGTFVGDPLEYPGAHRRPTIEISLPPGFPFRQPDVYVLEPEFTARSWHLNVRDDGRGRLCLYGHGGGNSDYPWSDPLLLLDRIREWFENDSIGWPDDPPVLEVEAYLPQSFDHLVVDPCHLENLDAGPPLTIHRRLPISRYWIWESRRDQAPTTAATHWLDESLPAVHVDLGEIDVPPRVPDDLLERIPDEQRKQVDTALDTQAIVALIARYHRATRTGLLSLHIARTKNGRRITAFAKTHELTPEVLALRSGPQAHLLRDTSIAVVGVGAVGSFLVDGLVRAGARNVDLYDSDILAPGNCVRHLCGLQYVGLSKAAAVTACLVGRAAVEAGEVAAHSSVYTPEGAARIVGSHYLTIDATASETATGMLMQEAIAAGKRFISVCILGDGEYVRADRWPLGRDEEHPPSPQLAKRAGPLQYEAGCGDPVSSTPPFVAQKAGSVACRLAVDLIDVDGPTLSCTVIEPG